jgi:hypothetical protein
VHFVAQFLVQRQSLSSGISGRSTPRNIYAIDLSNFGFRGGRGGRDGRGGKKVMEDMPPVEVGSYDGNVAGEVRLIRILEGTRHG